METALQKLNRNEAPAIYEWRALVEEIINLRKQVDSLRASMFEFEKKAKESTMRVIDGDGDFI